MEIIGRIITVLPVTSGVSSKGNAWQKGGFVIETIESYPKKICFGVFGEERIAKIPCIGDIVNVSFDIDSHEFEGRWYTSVNAFRIELAGAGATKVAPQQLQVASQESVRTPQNSTIAVQDANQSPKTDDLPF